MHDAPLSVSSGGEVNDGENKVFPIQVSRQELFLFLSRCYFYGMYKSTNVQEFPRLKMPHIPKKSWFYPLYEHRQLGQINAWNEGEVNSPIQVHCEERYFYCGSS